MVETVLSAANLVIEAANTGQAGDGRFQSAAPAPTSNRGFCNVLRNSQHLWPPVWLATICALSNIPSEHSGGTITSGVQPITNEMIRKILLAFTITHSATSVFAQNTLDRPLITVTGQAEILVVPDEVAFNLRVVTLEKELPAAQVKNDQVVKTLLGLARK